jgi:hypothetical protein
LTAHVDLSKRAHDQKDSDPVRVCRRLLRPGLRTDRRRLSSYLLGDSILQFSTIIGCYLFAMGVGAHLSKYVADDDVLARFIDIELAVGLIGGVSAALLFMTFSWMRRRSARCCTCWCS